MKMSKKAQEIFDRYLLGVQRSLPSTKREDIAKEIESLLLDQLEERYPDSEEISEGQLKMLLEEMGSPSKLAIQFSPQRYLISPRLFPIYMAVLKIVVPVVVGALTLSIIIQALTGDPTGTNLQILEYLGTLWNGAFMSAAFVTLVFAIIDYVNKEKEIEELKEFDEFKVEDLPELSAKDTSSSIPEAVIETIFGVIGLAFFTYIYNTNGGFPYFWNPQSNMQIVRIFTDNFIRFVPFMMAITGLEVSRRATYLAQGRSTRLTAWWHIITDGANMILTGFLLRSFPLITLQELNSLAFTTGWDLVRIEAGIHTGLKVIMILSLVGTGIDIIRRIYRQISNPV